MKKILLLLLACCLAAGVLGCRGAVAETVPTQTTVPATAAPATTEPAITEPVTTEPTATEPVTTEPIPTEPAHSDLYLEGVAVEEVIQWFNEVVLDGELRITGDPSLVQKWETPICYEIYGESTDEDLKTLETFAAQLNAMEGFPGISQAQPGENVNLAIHFTDRQSLLDILGQEFEGTDGGFTFWYDGMNRVYDEIICIRTDLDQHLRNSVLIEELYNGMGPAQDTQLRPDSIIYQEFTQPQEPTPVDWLILRLLYHPDIRCGMDAAQCESVIRSLYY